MGTRRRDNRMRDDVLAPFKTEWEERKRIAAEQPLSENVPRLENRRRGVVLVRAEQGDDLRGHAVTVRFTPVEWALIRSTVLGAHGLIAAPEES